MSERKESLEERMNFMCRRNIARMSERRKQDCKCPKGGRKIVNVWKEEGRLRMSVRRKQDCKCLEGGKNIVNVWKKESRL